MRGRRAIAGRKSVTRGESMAVTWNDRGDEITLDGSEMEMESAGPFAGSFINIPDFL